MGLDAIKRAADAGPRPYGQVLSWLVEMGAPVLVGGGYAFEWYTGIVREPRDLDVFVRKPDHDAVLRILAARGCAIERVHPHWLAKARLDGHVVDVIFSSGNAVAEVDAGWFAHAVPADVLGVPVRLCPPEEMIWSKAFVMERERYDGADVLHLLGACGPTLDWPRLLRRFGRHWRVLLSHLVLFGFVYPSERHRIPDAVLAELVRRLEREAWLRSPDGRVCRGTLLSRQQYLVDVRERGFQDARVAPHGRMRWRDVVRWTAAIGAEPPHERRAG